jgi:hypothetical protein
MPASNVMSYTDKVIHVIGTYGLPVRPEVIESIRQSMDDAAQHNGNLLLQEQAAMTLVGHLYPMVIAALRSGNDARGGDEILDAWSKFTQQAMYRSDLGLINLTLFNEEILPLIDDVERVFRDHVLNREDPQPHLVPRGVGIP